MLQLFWRRIDYYYSYYVLKGFLGSSGAHHESKTQKQLSQPLASQSTDRATAATLNTLEAHIYISESIPCTLSDVKSIKAARRAVSRSYIRRNTVSRYVDYMSYAKKYHAVGSEFERTIFRALHARCISMSPWVFPDQAPDQHLLAMHDVQNMQQNMRAFRCISSYSGRQRESVCVFVFVAAFEP